jgi:D-arginine dehydrogenase
MIYDFVVIGAGMAGASAAYELSTQGSVLLLEAESQAGYHSTGRSAALFTRNYGTAMVREINGLSSGFFTAPPDGFCEHPLLTPRGALAVAPHGEEGLLDPVLAASTPANTVVELSVADALEMVPILRADQIARAVYEESVTDIEVAMMLQSYLKGVKRRGGVVETRAPVTALKREADVWEITAGRNTHRGKTLINAAGAWADQIGAMAGAEAIGLVAKRRTAIILDAPQGMDVAQFPCVDFATNDAYLKPEAGKFMASPGDATPVAPQDVQPDEMDVAILADWIERHTLIPVRRISHSWAGLRSFVPDEGPVVGRDGQVPDFIWHAGQGGYGIMMAPSLARAVAAICADGPMPEDFVKCGLTQDILGPERLNRVKD